MNDILKPIRESRYYLDGAGRACQRGRLCDHHVSAGRRPVPELKSSNFMQRSFGERVAMNSPIQGTAADIIKIAMNRVHDRSAKKKGWSPA